jgi:protein-disulfide isomerase
MLNKQHHPQHDQEERDITQVIEVKKNNGIYVLPAAILISAMLISGSIFYNTKIFITKGLNGTNTTAFGTNAGQDIKPSAPQQAPSPAPDSGPVKVSVDDDPVLGNKNAPLTLIEFSDYECPFCKRYFTDTFPEIKKNYVDTGKLKIVYRDYPLPFHNPLATTEAIAANCSREQGGDATYFKYHDEVFQRTKSNGQGLVKDDLYKIASDLKLNAGNFKNCLDSEKYKDEIAKDTTDGSAAGVSGTPTVFIGKSSSDGKITATKVVGAQPYTSFKPVIDQLLQK